MDPITTAIAAALAAGAVSGATEVGKNAIADGYNALKTAIKRKFGSDSKIAEAVDTLESEPDFKPNQDALAGRVDQVNALDDSELKELAQKLLDEIKAQPGGEQHVQTAIGSYIAQADRGGTASVTVGTPKKSDE